MLSFVWGLCCFSVVCACVCVCTHAGSLFDEAGGERGVPRELEAAEIQTS